MRTTLLRTLVVLIALGLVASPGLAAGKPATASGTPAIEQAIARLAILDQDLDGLRGRIESFRRVAPAVPSSISKELGQARPRVREAVSLVFGLHWTQVEPVLAAAHAIEKKIADLEERVRTWPTSAQDPVPPVASPSASGAITGIVTDEATGLPLANVANLRFGVGLWVRHDATPRAAGSSRVSGTGTYYAYTSGVPVGYARELFNNLPCNSYCDSYSGTPIAVTDGAVTSGVNFALARTGSISGTVTDLTSGTGRFAGLRRPLRRDVWSRTAVDERRRQLLASAGAPGHVLPDRLRRGVFRPALRREVLRGVL